MDPNFDVLIAVCSNHLTANFHVAVGVSQLSKRLNNFNFLGPPDFGLRDDGLDMDFVGVDMVDALVILVIEKHPADVDVGLFHAELERFNLHRMLNVYYVFVGVFRSQLIPERVWMVWDWLPVLRKQDRDPRRDVIPHWIILF